MANLPSFQIEVTEEISSSGKEIIHRLNVNTMRICKDVNPSFKTVEQVLRDKPETDEINNFYPKLFYTRIATELSSFGQDELLQHFSDMRVCFKANKSQKNYNFQF